MQLIPLRERPDIDSDTKLNGMYTQLGHMLQQLDKKTLTPDLVSYINGYVEEINQSTLAGSGLRRLVRSRQNAIATKVEKVLKIVPKNYYRNLWMMVGLSVFGLPLGVAIGTSVGNMGLLAAGLPMGMAIGLALGSSMDKKAMQEGRQLDVELKH